MHRDVYGFYGETGTAKHLLTTAPIPNAQAMIEHTASAITGMLSGYRHFGPIGQLSLDEVYSPAMVILDLDILRHAGRISQGVASGQGLALDALPDVINSVLRDNIIFAEHETTITNMRKQYHQPVVLKRMARGQWEYAGRPDIIQDAQREADRLVAQYNYEPPRDILRELRRIYERAKTLF